MKHARQVTVMTLIIIAVCLSGCTTQPTASPSASGVSDNPATFSPDSTLELNDAVLVYLGPDAALGDYLVRDTFSSDTPTTTPFSFCFVSTETTPTAAGAAALLLTLGERDGGHGRHIVLRIDITDEDPGRGQSSPTVVLFWNPTDLQSYSFGYNMEPGPHTLGVYANDGGGIFSPPFTDTVMSDVTTDTLIAVARGDGGVLDEIRSLTGLK
jgi:hypothetical protein